LKKKALWIFIGGVLWAAAVSWTGDLHAADGGRSHRQQQLVDAARAEQRRLEGAGLIYRNDGLDQYLNAVAARLIRGAAANDPGARVQVLRDPYLHAYTLPGGFCYVSTGMLARIDNEAQLAAMMAHELAHILRRHALNGVLRLHGETQVPAVAAGYRMDAEIEADRDSLQMMVRAGYDPRETIRLYQHLQEELELEKTAEPLFSRTHPRLSRRIEAFREMIADLPPGQRSGESHDERFRRQVLTVMLDNAEMDIGVGRFLQAQRTLEKYLGSVSDDPKAHFLMGEFHRQQGCSDSARTWYLSAIELDDKYAAPHRALGLICYKTGEASAARRYLSASLSLAPEAVDNAYIRHYLERLSD